MTLIFSELWIMCAATCRLEVKTLNMNSHKKCFEFTHRIQIILYLCRKCDFTSNLCSVAGGIPGFEQVREPKLWTRTCQSHVETSSSMMTRTMTRAMTERMSNGQRVANFADETSAWYKPTYGPPVAGHPRHLPTFFPPARPLPSKNPDVRVSRFVDSR